MKKIMEKVSSRLKSSFFVAMIFLITLNLYLFKSKTLKKLGYTLIVFSHCTKMPITIRDLNKGRQLLELVTIEFDKSVQSALSTMLEKNLSQLPVVDGDKKLMGIISMESILKAQQFFSVPFTDLSKLCVSHAAAKCKEICTDDDELSDVFEKVKQYGSLVIVDGNDREKPTGIICIDDLLDFYYRRAENILLL